MQWVLLGVAIAAYICVFVSITYWSPIGLVVGLAVSGVVGVICVALQFFPQFRDEANSTVADYYGTANAPAVIAGWIRRLGRRSHPDKR